MPYYVGIDGRWVGSYEEERERTEDESTWDAGGESTFAPTSTKEQ